MGQRQIQKFIALQDVLQCSLCGGGMRLAEGSMRCGSRHCFDVAAKGYVNFLPGAKPAKGYDGNFFESRRRLLEAGFYSHILDEIQGYLAKGPIPRRIVDAGCGEGYYARHIQEKTGGEVVAFDIAKEAIRIAAAGGNPVCWLVCDLANIPLADRSADCLLNIFSPANYAEFRRVLKEDGMIVKVVPGQKHLSELRHAMRAHIRNEAYSNQDVVTYFSTHFTLIGQLRTTKTLSLQKEQASDLFRMTPLLFGVDAAMADRCEIDQITIDAELLIGKPPIS